MDRDGSNAIAAFRTRLRQLYLALRQPTYRTLQRQADQAGMTLPISTISNLLNGPVAPRWQTVETYIRLCARHAAARQIAVPADLLDLGRWHSDYHALNNRPAQRARRVLEGSDGNKAEPGPPAAVRPAQLPTDLAGFTGRVEILADLDHVLALGARPEPAGREEVRPAAALIATVVGTAGVGKTTLAVHWAHRVADRFPDGQLYLNLRGADPGGRVMEPAEAIAYLLDALGVDPKRRPSHLDAQAALYRSMLSDRQMLVVLDNARDSEHVRLLLPAGTNCRTLVTSRNVLTGLVATGGAYPLTLGLFTDAEARRFLAQKLRSRRPGAEPQAVERVLAACAHLPLALAVAAAHAVTRPQIPLTTLAAQLAHTSDRLDALVADGPGADVRAVFSWSYRGLSQAAARLFRHLGLHPHTDISTSAASCLSALPRAQVGPLLAELTRTNLLAEHAPGRYTFHDLLHAYATELARTHETEDERSAAIGRLVDHYLHTAHTAAGLIDPHRDPIPGVLAPLRPAASPERLYDTQEAMAWLTAEHRVLVAVVHQAAETGLHTPAWQLAHTLTYFLDRLGQWHDLETIHRTGVAAAAHCNDPAVRALARRHLATANFRLGRYDDADENLREALELYRRCSDPSGQAYTHHLLSQVSNEQGRNDDAIYHSQSALALFRAAGHRRGQAMALNGVGWHHAQQGDYRKSFEYCAQALIQFQELKDRLGEAVTWDSLGYIHRHLAQHAEAIAGYSHALRLFDQVDDNCYKAHSLEGLGDAYEAMGDTDAARHAWGQALALLRAVGHPAAEELLAKLTRLLSPQQ
ncbi:tetratricopeptide repeat protein [Plantactinospora sp. CA-290183]|uniref:tetratricopeptide repeat protein n=1 Tax=Plantactinospora sp. CA-290183 TaxID=3240006 RepID=UPI003D8C132D